MEEFSTLCEGKGYEVFVKKGQYLSASLKGSKRIRKVSEVPRGISLAVELTNINSEQKKKNLAALDKKLPADVPILSSSVTLTVIEQASWIRHQERLTGFGAFPTFLRSGLIEIAPSFHTNPDSLARVKNFLWDLGLEVSVVQDRIGLVVPRIISMLVNEAAFAIMEDVATAEDIDIAMKLGTNYPEGPIQWGEKIGFDQVLAVLTALHGEVGDDRYRVAPILRQLALSGCAWKETTAELRIEP